MRPALLSALLIVLASLAASRLAQADAAASTVLSSAEILAASSASDWRRIDDENLMVIELGRTKQRQRKVLIELAPRFAPQHVANVKALVRERYFDGLSVMRLQDNYVAQWGDADGKRPIRSARKTLSAEFFTALNEKLAFTPLGDVDAYANGPSQAPGFSHGMPSVRDSSKGEAWLAHCYGMVGAGRDNAPDSGGGTELYAVIGHAPRHLDRNVTLLGRVVQGIEHFASLPRGTGAQGFYEQPRERAPIRRVRIAADLPAAQRPALEALRTDTATWTAFVDARRNRRETWFAEPSGRIELCNVPLPVRIVEKSPGS